ncbi:hypoxanthine phosphoribosyltransferase [Colidextribacter sp. 210702-DFI.3.9]|nr:hypoxanthine phosphoribosyltransferase [Colidextribacter sp. 210702-DFI.3.9]MCG4469714.1 hypoxanthine phosphoribosyltransferase [Lawsonibacter sp. DFI.6.74]MCG4774124.1 hypoxanthine phosphoribosyltransferase [Lawsonibacter sp. DFI.5.51]
MSIFDNDIQEVLFSEEQLKNRVQEIARQITADYQGKEIMLISVLRGSFVFMADLCRAIDLPCTLDFMAVSSYGKGTKSSGQVQITKDLSEDITDRHIIVVEDILDSGNTLSYLLKILENRHPASIRLCTLLDKPDRRVKPVQVHYSGFTIPDAFVVGYGLDYAEKYRNLPYIGILKPRVYGG